VRFIGLDVHLDFCEIAIHDGAPARSAGRIKTERATLQLFAQSLGSEDVVALEATGNSLAIAEILRRHVREVVIANAMQVRAISHARIKNDKVDARTLADLLAAGLLPAVWQSDQTTRWLRRMTRRRAQLVRQRTRAKNAVSAVLMRNLCGRCPFKDPFGNSGRQWLSELDLPADETQTVQASIRQVDFFDAEIGQLDRQLAGHAVGDPNAQRLMTIPGIDLVAASTMLAVIGDARRFRSARQVVGYVGLDPRVRQSGVGAAKHGQISKRGSSAARHVLVEAAWTACRTPGPLRAFGQRIAARRGKQVAMVAVARKIAMLCWRLLVTQRNYAYQRPMLVARKMRRLELTAGYPRQQGKQSAARNLYSVAGIAAEAADQQLAQRAEDGYRQMMRDWHATRPQPA
jgi:transposase